MKLIFSRKGFDSSAGGVPSPIVEGRPISFPIPTRMPTPITFGDLTEPIPTLIEQLTRGRHTRATPCHLDPDLDSSMRPRSPGWRGALGQLAAAQSHLIGQGVGVGDLFLFWGLFRPVSQIHGHWSYEGKREHRVFGWLQIGEVFSLGVDGTHVAKRYPWLEEHPHVRAGWPENNTLYIAADRLTLDGRKTHHPGFGLFNTGFRLTESHAPSPSIWAVPDWLNPTRGGTGLTYHPLPRWSSSGTLKAAARGQEFVADITNRADALAWLDQIFAQET
ncbi:hypothetical protein ACS64U_004290 [Pseudomonas aeruginosa]